jgi:hypothetical protein
VFQVDLFRVDPFSGGKRMRRTTLAVCGAVAALAALTACGTTATTGTAAAGAAKPAVTNLSDLAHLVSSRTASLHTAHAALRIDAAGMSVVANGQVDIEGAASRVRMDMTVPSLGDLNMVLIGDTMYMKLPHSLLPTAKPWIKVDAHGTDPVSKALAAVTSQEKQSVDPSQMLSQLASVGTITSHGTDTVAGESATRYTISVDTAKLMKSKDVTPQMRQMLSGSGTQLPPHLNYTVWVNSANLPVKFSLTENVSLQGQPKQVTIAGTYTDWGKPVDITAPAADQVGPLPSH